MEISITCIEILEGETSELRSHPPSVIDHSLTPPLMRGKEEQVEEQVEVERMRGKGRGEGKRRRQEKVLEDVEDMRRRRRRRRRGMRRGMRSEEGLNRSRTIEQ